jgi:cytochrome c peroxidase
MVSVLVLGLASQSGAAEGPHGAAATSDQLKGLEALLGDVTQAVEAPAGVDAQVWAAIVPDGNEQTPERIELGRRLYFEPALSKDGSVSCATCHDVTRSFTDRRGVSEGIRDQLGRRNAPTTMNAVFLQKQFWDGRAGSLEEQAGQPILNPVEMGMPDRETAVAAVKAEPGYAEAFQAAYGRDINYDDLERAIAAFERTLVFLNSPFDRFQAGEASAVSESARRGFALFNEKGRCVACHPITRANPTGSDNRFHNIGVSARTQDFEKLASRALEALGADPSERKLDELAVGTDMSELGRFMVTRNYAEIGAFRTPQLRNVGVTAPYMHDGSMQTLWDTIDHYNRGGEPNAYLDGGMEALALTEAEIDDVVAFLFSLTDDRFADLNAEEQERQKAHAATNRPFRNEDLAFRRVLDFELRLDEEAKP